MIQPYYDSIADLFIKSASTWPSHEALIAKEMRLTYDQLLRRIVGVYKQLTLRAVQQLDKVAWADKSSSRFIEVLYATALSGAVGVPLDVHSSIEEWTMQCQMYDVKFLFVAPELIRKALEVFEQCKNILCVAALNFEGSETVIYDLAQRVGEHNPGGSQPGDALILSTSGTTGKPKGVVLTHNNLNVNQKSVVEYMKITEQDKMLVVKPLIHSSTLIEILSILHSGGRLVLAPWISARGVLAKANQEQCGIICVVPTMVRELLDTLRLHAKINYELRAISVSGAPIASETLYHLAAYLPRCDIFHVYGLTEAAPRVTALLPLELFTKAESVGRPIPFVEVAIVGENGCNLPAGTVGELVVHGPNVMRCYYCNSISTKYALRDFGLHTGDIATMDTEGYVYLHGRIDDLINCGGQKVYPHEIEQVLMKHPAILEVAVCGQVDDRLGQVPVAWAVSTSTKIPDLIEIKRHCLKYLAPYKVPHQIHWCPILPYTTSGKIKRSILAFD